MVKRFIDWYQIHKNVPGATPEISQDLEMFDRLISHIWPKDTNSPGAKVNLEYGHQSARDLLGQFEAGPDDPPDIYIITKVELSKKPLSELFQLYEECYKKSTKGIYIALLSYYLKSNTADPTLTGSYSENIDFVLRKNLSFANRIENLSTIIDYPTVQANKQGTMIEGANWIFVHPNIKYFLWK